MSLPRQIASFRWEQLWRHPLDHISPRGSRDGAGEDEGVGRRRRAAAPSPSPSPRLRGPPIKVSVFALPLSSPSQRHPSVLSDRRSRPQASLDKLGPFSSRLSNGYRRFSLFSLSLFPRFPPQQHPPSPRRLPTPPLPSRISSLHPDDPAQPLPRPPTTQKHRID
jgi:hypothetical protein